MLIQVWLILATTARHTLPLILDQGNVFGKSVIVQMRRDVKDEQNIVRSDFIFVGDVPHFLEINTVPGLTEESLLPQQAKHAGISLKDLFGNALLEAMEK